MKATLNSRRVQFAACARGDEWFDRPQPCHRGGGDASSQSATLANAHRARFIMCFDDPSSSSPLMNE